VVRLARTLLIGLAVVVLGLVALVYMGSDCRLRRTYAIAETTVAERSDSTAVARGAHLYQSISCALCHGKDAGGALYSDAGPFALFAGPNLTRGRGGFASRHTNRDWVRAIRHGVRPDGTSLILMPSEVFVYLSDADLGAILGYLRQLPAVDRELPATHFRIVGRMLLAMGKLNLLVAEKTPPFQPPDVPPPGPTAAYGRYLANIAACHGCHGFGLSGGAVAGPPGLPPAANLTPEGLSGWTQGDFVRAMREGKRPNGSTLHPFMPWEVFRNMADDDLTALWLYLRSVPARPFGNK